MGEQYSDIDGPEFISSGPRIRDEVNCWCGYEGPRAKHSPHPEPEVLSQEIAAMADINRLLGPFDNKTRRRMLEWVVAFQAELPVAVIPTPSRGED